MAETIRRARRAKRATRNSGGDVGRRKVQPDLTTYSGRVAAQLRSLREKSGWTVEETIERLERAGLQVARATYFQWEQGRRAIAIENLPALAQVFGKTVRSFLPAE